MRTHMRFLPKSDSIPFWGGQLISYRWRRPEKRSHVCAGLKELVGDGCVWPTPHYDYQARGTSLTSKFLKIYFPHIQWLLVRLSGARPLHREPEQKRGSTPESSLPQGSWGSVDKSMGRPAQAR